MASPEEVITSLPDTLPDDFGGWDSEGSDKDLPTYSWDREAPPAAAPEYSWEVQTPAAVEPVKTNEWEEWEAAHSGRKTAKPSGQSVERRAILSPAIDELHVSESAPSAPASVEHQKEFTDRDNEAPAAAKQVDSDEWAVWAAAHSSRKTPKPLGQSAERKAMLSPVVEKPRVSDSATSSRVLVKPQESTRGLAGESTSSSSRSVEASHTAHAVPAASGRPNFAMADEALFQMFSSAKFEAEGGRTPANKKKKWMIVGAVGVCSILLLLLLMIPLFRHGTKSAERQSVQPLLVADNTQMQPDRSKPRPGEPLTQDKASATATPTTQQATDNPQASEQDASNSAQTPTETQTQMMNDQLSAPTKIPQGIKTQVAENEPAATSFGVAGAVGLGGSGANASIFNGHAQTVVRAAPVKPIAISSGVAVGMLIRKTPPIYPPIAKTARVSGTVELQATISKMGTIEDLRAVSGPVMLRQAAVDAVRTWRYQPYKLNNEPTEVETTVNVVFSLGG
jgi:protein TonB